MTVRVHGFNHDERLGYFMGDNALASVAVAGAEIKASGVIMTLADFKKMYAVDTSKDIAASVPYNWIDDTNTAHTKQVPNTSVEARTFAGVVIADDAAYLKAYAAQHNLLRLVNTIQQRSVIMGISKAGAHADIEAGDVNANGAYSKWNLAVASVDSVTVMIERATVYDRMRPNHFGQPTGLSVIGKELVDDFLGLVLLAADGATAVTLDATNYSVRVDRNIPQI